MEKPAVFISYSREDLEAAVKLEKALIEQGLSPWRDQESIYAGAQWPKTIGEAIAENGTILLLWSRASAESHFVEFEWTTAIALKKTIIPCLIDNTPLPPSLISFNGIPYREIGDTLPRIMAALDQKRAKAKTDARRKSQVLSKLQQVSAGDSESMARASVMMVSQAFLGGEEEPRASAKIELEKPSDVEGLEIGDRYKVIQLLGQGGMGAVYHVRDRELDRDVALKVIRGDLAENQAVLERFKREIRLSSKVTHKNVLRVYDLGEHDGIKFLTMQYVEGKNLEDIMRKEGKLPLDRVIHIFRQICDGLAAAHQHGILHRDLKPANVMVDADDNVYLTDFGLATSAEQSGITQAGELMGTPHYMSPEQVKGEGVDAQSDIYSLGVILYEMVTGKVPFSGNTVFEVMIQRTQKPPRPAIEVNPETPPYLDRIIKSCMAREKAARYQKIEELLADLDQGKTTGGKTMFGTQFYMRRLRGKTAFFTWKRLAIVLPLLVLIVLGGWFLVERLTAPPPQVSALIPDTVSVLVADFQNETGEELFEGAIEQTFEVNLEDAAFITVYGRGKAKGIAHQIQEGAERLDESLARLVAQREGIAVIVSGSIANSGEGYEISARAIDAITGEEIEASRTEVEKREDVLASLGRLTAPIRSTLGDTTPESAQLAAAETFTTSSLEAAQAYAKGQEHQAEGDSKKPYRPTRLLWSSIQGWVDRTPDWPPCTGTRAA